MLCKIQKPITFIVFPFFVKKESEVGRELDIFYTACNIKTKMMIDGFFAGLMNKRVGWYEPSI